MDICFATNNRHKLEEVKEILDDSFRILSLSEIGCFEDLPEEQETLEGNSHQKASYVLEKYKISCFADDTGLEVFALNGQPGVKSARYAGEGRDNEANIQLLLQQLADKENREARFRTVVTFATPDAHWQFEGIIKGTITNKKKGEQGFGYDSVFIPEHHTKTFAEMSSKEKNEISHRAIAVNKLADFLNNSYKK